MSAIYEYNLLKNLIIKLKSFEYLNYILGSLFLLAVVSPSLGLMFGTSSMAEGLAIVIVLCLITVLYMYSLNTITIYLQPTFNVLAIILVSILAHGLINYSFHGEQFNLTRFLLSFIYLIFVVVGAFSFVLIMRKANIKKCNFIFNFLFISFVLIALLSAIGFSPFQIGGKSIVFYSEPSHYALDFLPLLLFTVIQANQKNKVIYLVVAFEIALVLQSLTLMVGVILVSIIALRVWSTLITLGLFIMLYYTAPLVHDLFSFVNSSSEIVMYRENDNSYIISRLPITAGPVLGSVNGSFLVYFSGWERAFLNFLDYFGFGVGFQQLGFIGNWGDAMERLVDVYYKPMGLFDGGAVAPKLVSEFGVFALVCMGCYTTLLFKTIKNLRLISLSSFSDIDIRNVFFMCYFVMYAINLFIRAPGYFSMSSFLFISSIFWISLSNNQVFRSSESDYALKNNPGRLFCRARG